MFLALCYSWPARLAQPVWQTTLPLLQGRSAIESENRGCLATASKGATAAWTGGWVQACVDDAQPSITTDGRTTSGFDGCRTEIYLCYCCALQTIKWECGGWRAHGMRHVRHDNTVISAQWEAIPSVTINTSNMSDDKGRERVWERAARCYTKETVCCRSNVFVQSRH